MIFSVFSFIFFVALFFALKSFWVCNFFHLTSISYMQSQTLGIRYNNVSSVAAMAATATVYTLTSIFVAKTEACWIFSRRCSRKEEEKTTRTKYFHQQNKQKLKPTLFIFNERKKNFEKFLFWFARLLPTGFFRWLFFCFCLVPLIYFAQFHYCWRLWYYFVIMSHSHSCSFTFTTTKIVSKYDKCDKCFVKRMRKIHQMNLLGLFVSLVQSPACLVMSFIYFSLLTQL